MCLRAFAAASRCVVWWKSGEAIITASTFFSSSATVCGSVVPCDAQVVSGSAVLGPGTSFVSIPYSVFGDTVDEPDEFFSIAFAEGGAFSFGAVTVTIIDDDAPVTTATAPFKFAMSPPLNFQEP